MKKKLLGLGVLALTASTAFADGLDVSQVQIDTNAVTTLAGTILTGLGVIWGIRKVIKLMNRS